ncbi:purine nucleoside phosphorylase [Parcubacteria bacterium DG_74_2]|nr:MAG: purine nucleoside phosphorylase [Parcubacteria bacterium DG_74_2]
MKLCSTCLLGINCRYDGKSKPNKKVLKLAKKEVLIPVCPEQFGGLPTPRESAEQKGKRVITKSGKDVTRYFKKGAREVLKIVKLFKVKEAILKQRSPSCGSGKIYDGTFSGKIIKGDGVTTALLKKNKIKVISEEDL